MGLVGIKHSVMPTVKIFFAALTDGWWENVITAYTGRWGIKFQFALNDTSRFMNGRFIASVWSHRHQISSSINFNHIFTSWMHIRLKTRSISWQDRSASLAVSVVRPLLYENGDVLLAGSFSALTVAHLAVAAAARSGRVFVCGPDHAPALVEEMQELLALMEISSEWEEQNHRVKHTQARGSRITNCASDCVTQTCRSCPRRTVVCKSGTQPSSV